MTEFDAEKAALRGEPSHVWRAGQQRRLEMIREAAGERARGRVLVDGCGLGAYLVRLAPELALPWVDIEAERACWPRQVAAVVARGSSAFCRDQFDLC
jgi:hypothetical protein